MCVCVCVSVVCLCVGGVCGVCGVCVCVWCVCVCVYDVCVRRCAIERLVLSSLSLSWHGFHGNTGEETGSCSGCYMSHNETIKTSISTYRQRTAIHALHFASYLVCPILILIFSYSSLFFFIIIICFPY